MADLEKIRYLVVDTSGFIKNAQFQEIAENILTPPAVTKEITSQRQIRRLAVLPYDLSVKEPFAEELHHVTEFAKKTGDYASLSSTDLQVIALTYQLEKQHVGTEHLRAEPIKRVINPEGQLAQEFKNVVGFYIPKHSDEIGEEEEENQQALNESEIEITETQEESNKVEETENDVDEGCADDENNWSDFNEEEEQDDDDDEGWITPSNIKEMKRKILSEVVEEKKPVVGCLTTDYAMQNVLKQMGLNVISLDGRVIKELRTFILRCYACYKTTCLMSKLFCPNCGNKTLKKVAVTTNPDGTQKMHINFRKPLTARGKRFSLPTPKGGKHANNPILCEDQPLPQQRASKLSRCKTQALEDDYIAGFSPFVARDVTSRSAMMGIRPNSQVKQWMRKNPNENNKPGGRKRK